MTLVTVKVETQLGDEYVFPGMDLDELQRMLPESGRMPEGQPTLVLLNSSYSVLSIVFRIVKRIAADGEVLWESPV